MKQMDKILFSSSEKENTKRENANVNGNSSMGKMLQIGSYYSEKYADKNLITKSAAKKHKDGDIHIHDKDFLSIGTTTCLSGDTHITLRNEKGKIINTTLSYLDDYFEEDNNIAPEIKLISNLFILGRNGWTKLNYAIRRKINNEEKLYYLKTKKGLGLEVTETHKIPVRRKGKEQLLMVKDIHVNDFLMTTPYVTEIANDTLNLVEEFSKAENLDLTEFVICNIDKLKKWLLHQHDIKNLSTLINSKTSCQGTEYITILDYNFLMKRFDIPYNVLITLHIKDIQSENSLPILLPITNELAKIFGYIYHDRCFSVDTEKDIYEIKFFSFNNYANLCFEQCFTNVFPCSVSKTYYQRKESGRLISNKIITCLLMHFLGYKKDVSEIRIPNFILNGDNDLKYSFFSAVINKDDHLCNKSEIKCSTISKGFAEDLVLLLNSLGVCSKNSIRDCNVNEVAILKDEITLKVLKNLNRMKRNEILLNHARRGETVKFNTSRIVDKIELEKDIYVYDLQTAEHWFLANDYVVHNCSQIDLGKQFDRGFNTGHGFIRPPKRVGSRANLTAIVLQSNQNDQHGGQSVDSFDYYLQNGVLDSYRKLLQSKLITLLEYSLDVDYGINLKLLEEDNVELTDLTDNQTLLSFVEKTKPSTIEETKEYWRNFSKELQNDFEIEKSTAIHIAKKIKKDTIKEVNAETYQAMEGLTHNLNTMHCLPASERIWVFNKIDNSFGLVSMQEIYNNFNKNKYQVISLNQKTGKSELKDLTHIQRKDNNRNLVRLRTNYGQEVVTTDNHKIMTLKGLEISEQFPKDIQSILSPRGIDFPVLINNEIIITKELAELMGRYVANKNLTKDEEISLPETYLKLCGEKTLSKKIPMQIFFNAVEIKIAFLKGYLNGLGTCKNVNNLFEVKDEVINKDLRKQLGLMMLSLFETLDMSETNNSLIETLKYDLSFVRDFLPKEIRKQLSENITYLELNNIVNDNNLLDLRYLLNFFNIPIKDKETFNSGEEYVYDISVADNETFLTEDCIFVHNSRAGAQVPFTSINFGTCTTPEGRMVTKNLLLSHLAGLGKSETPIFPILIFKVKEGINYNPEDVNYDLFKLSCRVTAKRLFPNYSFLDAPFNLQYYVDGDFRTEISYMGCRTRNIANLHGEEVVTGRGNLSFTSINLPRLGILYKDENEFFKNLDKQISVVVKQLIKRYELQCSLTVKNFPFLMGQGIWMDSDNLGNDDTLESVLKHGSLTVGFIGLAETLIALTGKHHGECEESQKLGLKIIKHMRKRMDEATEKHQLNFALIATPAEGLSGRFTKIDKEKFGVIEGITDKDFYTNSFHVPVYHSINITAKINIEAPYHEFTNGGHISYVELDGDVSKNPVVIEKIVRQIHDAGIGYGSINFKVDNCLNCGYGGLMDNECPVCKSKNIRKIRRVTGYLSPLDNFGDGKRAEEKNRINHFQQ